MPFSLDKEAFAGPGTAPARASELENIDLTDSIPVAYTPDEIAREATRYIVFVGDVIIPAQKRERADLRLGGEYYGQQFRTLVRSKYLVRRCQMTPLEVGYDFINDEIMGDNPNGLTVVGQLQDGDAVPGAPPPMKKRLNAVPVYPGDEIKGILIGERNHDAGKGVVEVKALAGVVYDDFRKSGLQQAVFPNWDRIIGGVDKLPVKLSELTRFLNGRRQGAGEDLKSVIDAYLLSADQYREWGIRYLKYSAQLVRLQFPSGHVHTYSDLAEMLFDQLEVRREDVLSTDREIADILNKANASGQVSTPEMAMLMQKMVETQEMLAKAFANGSIAAPFAVPTPQEQPKAQCEAMTSAGTRCKNEAGPNGRCTIPQHQPEPLVMEGVDDHS